MSLSAPIIKRYVLAELLKVFLAALCSLTMLLLLVGVMRHALNEGLSLKHTLLLLPYLLPEALRFTVPATALFAAACVYGRMSGSNEVVALKSLGISPWSILWPTYVLAFFVSWCAVWLNDVAVTWGYGGARRVVLSAIEDVMLNRLQAKNQYASRNFTVTVKDVEGRRLIEPTFTVRDRQRNRNMTLRCQHATLQSSGQVFVLRCFNGSVQLDGETEFSFPNTEFVREIALSDLKDGDASEWSPSYMSLADIYRQLDDQPRRLESFYREQAVKAALQLVAADFGALAGREWDHDANTLQSRMMFFHRLVTEPPRRLANGFSCLSFVIVGSVMAMRLRNSNALSSFFACFLPILIVYYPMLVFSVDQAKKGAWFPQTVWIGNVALAIWGLWLLRRVMRY